MEQHIPVAVESRIGRDWKGPVVVAAARMAKYRCSGWFVAESGAADTGSFYYMRRDGRVQQFGSGYPTKRSDVVVTEVLRG